VGSLGGGRLVETLAALHGVNPEAVGLGDYGRPDGYAARQLRRWTGQWELIGADHLVLPRSGTSGFIA
jgi:aminoglycoside phosphotransferase (APT) family kinase protein